MANNEQNIKEFIERWHDKGNENQDTHPYWIQLLELLGVEEPTIALKFEKSVFVDGRKKRIDVFMPATKTLIEQKSFGLDLNNPEKQSDGAILTPYQQAKRYADNLPYSEKPNRIITCNFSEIRIYDLDSLRPEIGFISIKLENLENEIHKLRFLQAFSVEKIRKEEKISVDAGKLVKKLYDALREQFMDKDSPETLRALNILCVRLVFLMYAEDAEIFNKDQFRNYVKRFYPEHLRNALLDLFRQLNIKREDRRYVSPDVNAFPYVNGGLFKEETEIPQFTKEIVDILYEAMDFDWRFISAPIFGACYESTINPETRHQNGMHYTKSKDVAKLLDNLFLDNFRAELSSIRIEPNHKKRLDALRKLQDKIASIGIADFAAGSGNFGVEAYMSLRRIENEILTEIVNAKKKTVGNNAQMAMVFNEAEVGDRIKVSINQIHLAEINDFACDVAKVALWIAEAQMMKETKALMTLDDEESFLPLTTNANVVCCNSLTTPWEDIVPKSEINYIVQNPPYLGYSKQSPEQKNAIRAIYVDEDGKEYRNAGKIDLVAGWMFKAAEYIQGTDIRCAFVTTNSVTQGEQVASIWKPLYERFGIHIDFAYQSFKWNNGTEDMAQVTVIVFGFSCIPRHKHYLLYDKDAKPKAVDNINPYLKNAPTTFIESRREPICGGMPAIRGFQPTDGGHLIISGDEYDSLDNDTKKYIRPFGMGRDFIYGERRYCLWLEGISPNVIKTNPFIRSRVEKLKEWRSNQSKTGDAYKLKDVLTFRPAKGVHVNAPYLAIPQTSSEKRDYIPMAYVTNGMIPGNAIYTIANTGSYELGVLQSSVHMAWTKAVCGRLEERIVWSALTVYNNFIWPNPTEQQKARIEQTAQEILDARALYPDASLADLYDPVTMPIELRKAHQANDKAVMDAYGFSPNMTDDEIVAELMKLYQKFAK